MTGVKQTGSKESFTSNSFYCFSMNFKSRFQMIEIYLVDPQADLFKLPATPSAATSIASNPASVASNSIMTYFLETRKSGRNNPRPK